MDKRADLRKHFENEAGQEQSNKMHSEKLAQLSSIEETIANAFGSLLNFMENKISKVELTNQLREISTPDVANVVAELKKLSNTVISAKTDQKPVIDALNALKREITLIPSKMPKEKEQKETIKVSNLAEVKLDTSNLEKAIEALDLKVDVKAPIINTEKTNTKPLENLMAEVLKAINKQEPIESVKVSNLKDITPTDTTKIEKKQDISNKYLKEISEKRFGGGGGGGNGTPYIDSTGKPLNVVLHDSGNVPIDIHDSWGANIGSTMIDELMVSEKRRLCGGVFNGTVLDPNFYTTSLVSNATATITNSLLDIATTTDSGSSGLTYTNSVGRYIGGNMNHLRGVVRISNSSNPNNTMRFGVTSTSNLVDSFYFQITGSILSICAKTNGIADIKIDSGSFNGLSPIYTPSGNFITIEILFTNKKIEFYIDKVLIHALTETTNVICGTRHLRPFVQNFNTGVGIVTHGYCHSLTLSTWGFTSTQSKSYLQRGTTTGVSLKTGIGALHSLNISGVVNNAVVTIYDGLNTSGNIIYTTGAMSNQTVPITVPFDVNGTPFYSGLYLTITGASCNCQVLYE